MPRNSSPFRKLPTISTLVLLAIVILVVVFQSQSGAAPRRVEYTPPPNATPLVTQQTVDWYSIYFTDPLAPTAKQYRGGPDEDLAQAIRQASVSVDAAVQQLNLWSIRDALIDAHKRGLQVRLVMESDYMDEKEVQELISAGIEVLGDRQEGLMHNKFVILDRMEVWTGSMNFSLNDAYRNDNNLIRIRSPRLAQNYLVEFEEMFVQDQFGPRSPANTPYPRLTVNDTQIEVYFSPDDGVQDRLLHLIGGAQQSIAFLAYSFTSDELATAMLERAQAGVHVSGVFETSQYYSNQGTEFDHFLSSGVDVRLDGNPANMHHKVILIDDDIVITGSYNFSNSAETRNDENVLILYSAEIAAQYRQEFERIFNQADSDTGSTNSSPFLGIAYP
ncbi:MAG: DUF1669 domain-containing protein [Chloroflexi bacterium]|jgi:phosphatidylserine/phosphatidylglycerophosphate/cardiolipin synthase-like enzyme|nr:DUF1669 domain-containing protein [Chloroflexota bacterium]